jgi:hypothetical protein
MVFTPAQSLLGFNPFVAANSEIEHQHCIRLNYRPHQDFIPRPPGYFSQPLPLCHRSQALVIQDRKSLQLIAEAAPAHAPRKQHLA